MPTEGLLDACQALLEQRAAIAAVLDQLGPSWRDTRSALNELSRIVGDRTRTLWSVLLMPRRFGGEDDGVLRRRVAQEPVRQVHAGKHFSHAVNEVALLPALVPHWEDGDGNDGDGGMIIIVPEGPHTVRATFRLRCGVGRHEVCVVGEFNDWSSTANPMTFDGYCYVAEIVIPTGHAYRFRYLIDNDRCMIDLAADRFAPNELGGGDSILDLTRPRTSILASTGSGPSEHPAALASRQYHTDRNH